jgi:cell division protein FtsL
MANLARQLLQEQQQQTVRAPKKKHSHKRGFSPGEKILGFMFGALVCIGSTQIISNQADIYQVNKDIQLAQTEMQTQQKSISDLSIQVSELNQYDRIKEKARELGLQLNEKNIKVVQD